MRKVFWPVLAVALFGFATDGAAQQAKSSTRPGYIGIRYDGQYELLFPEHRASDQVIVKAVSRDSPAEKAGVKQGDEILRINGLSVANGKFAAVARTLTEGDTVKLRIKRDKSERDVMLVAAARPAATYTTVHGDRTIIFSPDSVRGLAKLWMDSALVHLDSMKLPRIFYHQGDSAVDIRIERIHGFGGDTLVFKRDSAAFRALRKRVGEAGTPDVFIESQLGAGAIFKSIELGSRAIAGAEFTELDPGMKTYFGTDRGLLTLRVAPETPAARAGLQVGDIVTKANGKDVKHVAELRAMLFFEGGAALKLDVLRKGDKKTLELRAGPPKGTNE